MDCMKIWIVWNKSLTLKWRTQMEGQMRKLHMSVGKITWPVMIHWLLMYARWVLKKRKEFVVIKLYLYTVFTLIYVTERSRVQVRETASCIKYRVRLRTIHQLVGPLPGPCVCRNLMHQAALFLLSYLCFIEFSPISVTLLWYLSILELGILYFY